MADKCFIIEDPKLDAVAMEFLVAAAQAGRAAELEGFGTRFDHWTARMGHAYVRVARMLDVLPGFFFSGDGRLGLMTLEQVQLAGGQSRRVITLPAEAAPARVGLTPWPVPARTRSRAHARPRRPAARRPWA